MKNIIFLVCLLFGLPVVTAANQEEPVVAPAVHGVLDEITVCRDFDARFIRQNMNAYVLTELISTFGTATDPFLSLQPGDIVPPFLYEFTDTLHSFPGQNWNEDTVAIFDSECRQSLGAVNQDQNTGGSSHEVQATSSDQVIVAAVSTDTLVRISIPGNTLPQPLIGGGYLLTLAGLDQAETTAVSESFLEELENFAATMADLTEMAHVPSDQYVQAATVIDAATQAKLQTKSPIVILPASSIATSSIDVAQAENLLATHIEILVTDVDGKIVPTFAGAVTVEVFHPNVTNTADRPVYGFHKGAISDTWMQRKWEETEEGLSVPIFGSGLVSLWSIELVQTAAAAESVTYTSNSNWAERITTCMPMISFGLLLGVLIMMYRTTLVTASLTRDVAGHPMIESHSFSYVVKHFVLLLMVATEIVVLAYVTFCLFFT